MRDLRISAHWVETVRRFGAGALSGRALSLFDQGLSSLSNFALTVCVARVSTPSEFGQFALAYSILIFFLGLTRAGVGEVLLVAYSRSPRRPAAWTSRPIGASLVIASLCAAVVLATGAVVGREQFALWALFAVASIVVLLQDTARHLAIVSHRPDSALVLDAIWAVVSVGPMIVLSLLHAPPEAVLLAWVAGAVASLVRVLRTYPRPNMHEGLRWIATNRRLVRVFGSEFAVAAAANTAVWFFLIPPIGEAGIGAVRGVLVLFSPLNTLFSAVTLTALPDLVRAVDRVQRRRRVMTTFAATGAVAVVWSVAVLLMPTAIGGILIGASWTAADPLRVPAAIHHSLLAVYTVLIIAFRAGRCVRQSSVMRGVSAACSLVLPVALAVPLGSAGASWGFAAALAVSVAVGLAVAVGSPVPRDQERSNAESHPV